MNQFQYFPISDPKLFEEFIRDYFNDYYKTESFKIYGRNGQTQKGFDVYSPEKKIFIQCKQVSIFGDPQKTRNKLSKNLESDFNAFQKYALSLNLPKPLYFYAASTFPDETKFSDFTIKNTNENLIIEYWSWTTLMNKIRDKTFDQYNNILLEENKKGLFKAQNKLTAEIIKIENKEELIKLLRNDISFNYEQLNFIPKPLIQNLILNRFSRDSYMGTNYIVPNHSIFEQVFKSIYRGKNGKIESSIQLNQEQLKSVKFISEKLYRNGLYYFEANDYQKHEFIFDIPKNCNCIRCRYFRFEFNQIDVYYKTPDESEFDFHFKRAFYFMKLGKWNEAINDWFKCLELTNTKINSINNYKVKYNLKKAASKLYSDYFLPDEFQETLNRIKSIEFEPFGFINQENTLLEKISKWMYNDFYVLEALEELKNYKKEIIKIYKHSHRNGIHNNSPFLKLYYCYFDLYSFLEENQIYFDDFPLWQEIVNVYFEGIIASYATKNTSYSIEVLNFYYLLPILNYGNYRDIVGIIEKYDVEQITIAKHEIDYPLKERIDKIIEFNSYDFKESFFTNEEEYSKKQFENKFEKWFNNTLIILAYVDFEDTYVKSCISKIIDKILSGYNRFDSNCLEILMENKATALDQNLIDKLIHVFWTLEKDDTKYFITVLDRVSTINNLKPKLNENEFNRFMEYYQSASDFELDGILNFIQIIANEQKTKAIQLLKMYLSEYKHNRIELYFKSLKRNYIDFNLSELKQYLKFVTPATQKNLIGRPLFERTNSSISLNELIELYFIYNFDVTEIQHLTEGSDYYSWLINLDEYDYSKFEVEWVGLYYSNIYFTEFKKHPIIKDKLVEYLKSNKNEILSKILLKLI